MGPSLLIVNSSSMRCVDAFPCFRRGGHDRGYGGRGGGGYRGDRYRSPSPRYRQRSSGGRRDYYDRGYVPSLGVTPQLKPLPNKEYTCGGRLVKQVYRSLLYMSQG